MDAEFRPLQSNKDSSFNLTTFSSSLRTDPEFRSQVNSILERSRRPLEQDLNFLNFLKLFAIEDLLRRVSAEHPVISIGCGNARDAIALRTLFGPGSEGRSFAYVGIDLDERKLASARGLWSTIDTAGNTELLSTFAFLRADVSFQDKLQSLHGASPLVIIRHQNFLADVAAWNRIFSNALRFCTDQGSVLITSFTAVEHEMAHRAFKSLGAETICTIRNPYAQDCTATASNGKKVIFAMDRFASIFRPSNRSSETL